MSENKVPIEIVGAFYDTVQGRNRGPEEGVVFETPERASSIVAIGAGRYVQEEKAQSGPPENKSLSGPPENKSLSDSQESEIKAARAEAKRQVEESAVEKTPDTPEDELDDLTVAELNNLAEERGITLPDGYVKKAELVNIIRSES